MSFARRSSRHSVIGFRNIETRLCGIHVLLSCAVQQAESIFSKSHRHPSMLVKMDIYPVILSQTYGLVKWNLSPHVEKTLIASLAKTKTYSSRDVGMGNMRQLHIECEALWKWCLKWLLLRLFTATFPPVMPSSNHTRYLSYLTPILLQLFELPLVYVPVDSLIYSLTCPSIPNIYPVCLYTWLDPAHKMPIWPPSCMKLMHNVLTWLNIRGIAYARHVRAGFLPILGQMGGTWYLKADCQGP